VNHDADVIRPSWYEIVCDRETETLFNVPLSLLIQNFELTEIVIAVLTLSVIVYQHRCEFIENLVETIRCACC
jgi:hypothetical protein